MKPTWLEFNTILQGVIGSEALGLSSGSSDRDEQGVCIEPLAEHLTLGSAFEQHVYREAQERTGDVNAKSLPGELDLKVYGLQKFCRLAAAGNPDVLMLLYLPKYTVRNALGGHLLDIREWFVSKEAGARFLGYMQGQRARLLGEKGQKRVNRPELESEHGYDVKYAMHLLRLGYQGVEFLQTGKLLLPMAPPCSVFLKEVRAGGVPLEVVISAADAIEQQLKGLQNTSDLPEHPNRPAIEAWMQEIYLNWWKANQTHLKPEHPHKLVRYQPTFEQAMAQMGSAMAKHKTRLEPDFEDLNAEIIETRRDHCVLNAAKGGSKE